nr:uncharacterized protein LOC129275237 [Lytechinus pictus]
MAEVEAVVIATANEIMDNLPHGDAVPNKEPNDIQEDRAGETEMPSEETAEEQDGEYPSVYFAEQDSLNSRQRSTWPEKRIMGLLDIYINEHPVYLKAKMERQITEFHDYIGQIVNTEGVLVAGLLKNLSREYRKLVIRARNSGASEIPRLRGSSELFEKFEQYYEVYNKLSPQDSGLRKMSKLSKLKLQKTNPFSSQAMPKIKKLKKSPKPKPEGNSFDSLMNPLEVKIPPVPVMSDKYCQEYIQVMREQNKALIDIGKELRLMRMGYFTEHELALD